jgi:hypothetical protein
LSFTARAHANCRWSPNAFYPWNVPQPITNKSGSINSQVCTVFGQENSDVYFVHWLLGVSQKEKLTMVSCLLTHPLATFPLSLSQFSTPTCTS